MRITRSIEFDAGHRVPDHASKCRNPHGHRYRLEVEVDGDVIEQPGNPANGMVIDFADVKAVLVDVIDAAWDHAFLVADHDPLATILRSPPGGEAWKVDVLAVVPTVENLAAIAGARLAPALAARGVRLTGVRLWETPTCSALWQP